MHETSKAGMSLGVSLVGRHSVIEAPESPAFTFDFVCRDAYGNIKWEETTHNLVTTVGKNDLINQYFKGAAYTAAWYLGLKDTGTALVTDTLASHAGWAELTPYTGNRPAIVYGTTAGGSNTASIVNFTITAGTTIYGAFTSSAASGTTGILYSATDFSSSRPVAPGDTLQVTPTVSFS